MKTLAVSCRDKRQSAAAGVGFSAKFACNMCGDTLHILHQLQRLLEYIRVDPLKDIAQWCAGLTEMSAIGVVDVTVAVGRGAEELALNSERARHGAAIRGRTPGPRF